MKSIKIILYFVIFLFAISSINSYNSSSKSYRLSLVFDSGGNLTQSSNYLLDSAVGLQSNKTTSESFMAWLGGIFYYIAEVAEEEPRGGGMFPWIPTIGTDYICNITLDFIKSHTYYGRLIYTEDDIIDLKMTIYHDKNVLLLERFLENYIQSHDKLCKMYFNQEIKTKEYEIYFNVLQKEYIQNSTTVGKVIFIYTGKENHSGKLDLFLTNCWDKDNIFEDCERFSLKSLVVNITSNETKVIKEMLFLPWDSDLGLWRMNMQYTTPMETFKLWKSFNVVLKKSMPITYVVLLFVGIFLYWRISKLTKKEEEKKKKKK